MNASPQERRSCTAKARRSIRRWRAVEQNGIDEGQTDQSVLGPFDDCRYEDSAFEADIDVRARLEVADVIAHNSAFRNVVQREALRRTVDQQLQLAASRGHSWKAALVGRGGGPLRLQRRGGRIVVPRFREGHGGAAKS